MKPLYNNRPQRLFTFGCSFTEYRWATWANILAFDLDCEFYNLGQGGSGNFYIANTIAQADAVYHFNQDDLIMVCWTNISREDRWTEQGWLNPGNIYSQTAYDKGFVKRWANDVHFALRDFALVSLIENLLENKTQFHFFSMCDITKRINQWAETPDEQLQNSEFDRLLKIYEKPLGRILPSFYQVLWNNDLDYKLDLDRRKVHSRFFDGHPTILEHFEFLRKTFDHDFKEHTQDVVNSHEARWIDYFKTNKFRSIYDLSEDIDCFERKFKIRYSTKISDRLVIKNTVQRTP
jgi:hypothetical protein